MYGCDDIIGEIVSVCCMVELVPPAVDLQELDGILTHRGSSCTFMPLLQIIVLHMDCCFKKYKAYTVCLPYIYII